MNGVKNIIKAVMVGMLIILAYLGMSCSEVKAEEWTICKPEAVEVCNICGRNYYNDGCPHSKEEIYGDEVCSPEEGELCNICNSDYDTCSHHIGEEYGGVECTTWSKCNICGNNYSDSSACSHYKGQSYGGTECEIIIRLVCNICDVEYNSSLCPHIEGAWYDEGYCETEFMELCNICGRKYEGGGCPHWVGEYYGGIVCEPIPTCNICGRPYENGGCPHWRGEYYGGTVCESYSGRICNICGYDYDDGDRCSHKINVSYNGVECETDIVRICNICKKDYYNGGCPHAEGEEYRNVAYYIYLPEWEDRAWYFKEMMKMYYCLEEEDVILIPVSNEVEFREAWNRIGREDGDYVFPVAVIIETHGDYEKLCDREGNPLLTEELTKQLTPKYVERLMLLGCNAGHLDNKEHNPAAYMSKIVRGASVLASDGTVDVIESSMIYTSSTSEDFPDMCDNGVRDNQGWMIYNYKGGKINVSESLGKRFIVSDILEAIRIE